MAWRKMTKHEKGMVYRYIVLWAIAFGVSIFSYHIFDDGTAKIIVLVALVSHVLLWAFWVFYLLETDENKNKKKVFSRNDILDDIFHYY